jgi:hypothetical protein
MFSLKYKSISFVFLPSPLLVPLIVSLLALGTSCNDCQGTSLLLTKRRTLSVFYKLSTNSYPTKLVNY